MNEAARLEALKSMGVTVLLSRFQLPGAKSSPVFESELSTDSAPSPQNATPTQVSTDAQSANKDASEKSNAAAVAYTNASSDDIAKQTIQSVSDLFSGPKSKRQSRAQAVLAAEKARAEAASAAEQLAGSSKEGEIESLSCVNYQHHCIQLDDLLVIIDPVDYLSAEGSQFPLAFDAVGQKQVVRFLHDVYSLAFKKKASAISINTFVWPPHKALPGRISPADMQQAFLNTLAQNQTFTYALVFSEGYVDALFSDADKTPLSHGYLSRIQTVNTLKVSSLQSYWANSSLKNALWYSVQSLIQQQELDADG